MATRQVVRHIGDNGLITWHAHENGGTCRLATHDDTTDSVKVEYDSRCSMCWLGYGHSYNLHKLALKLWI